MSDSPKALLFDIFGTCVDWYTAVHEVATEVVLEHGLSTDVPSLVVAWHDAYLHRMRELHAGREAHRTADQLQREALDSVAEVHGLGGLSDEVRNELSRAWRWLPAWRDVAGGLAAIRHHRMVATLSNINLAALLDINRFARLQWDCVLCADLFRHARPEPEVYQNACQMLELAPEQVMMVACRRGDLGAAAAAGLRTAFVHRPLEFAGQRNTDQAGKGDFDLVTDDFLDLAHQLESATKA